MMRFSWMPAAILGLFLAASVSWGQKGSFEPGPATDSSRFPCAGQTSQIPGTPIPCLAAEEIDECTAQQDRCSESSWVAFLVADSLNLWNLLWSLGNYEAAQAMAEEACRLEPDNLAAEHARVLSQLAAHPGFAEAVPCTGPCPPPGCSPCSTQACGEAGQECSSACRNQCSCAKGSCASGGKCGCAKKSCACGSSCACAKGSCACGPNCTCKTANSRIVGTSTRSGCCPCAETWVNSGNQAEGECPQGQILRQLMGSHGLPRMTWHVLPVPPPPVPPFFPPGHPMFEFCHPGMPCPAMMVPPVPNLVEGPQPFFPGQPPHVLCGPVPPPQVLVHPAIRRMERFVPPGPMGERPRPSGKPIEVSARGNRVHICTARFEATCNRFSYVETCDHVVLEGNVRLTIRDGSRTGKISAERVEVGVHEDFYEVTASGPQQSTSSRRRHMSSSAKPTSKPVDKNPVLPAAYCP